MKNKITLIVVFLLSYCLSFAQCGTFFAPDGTPGAMTTVDLGSFDAAPTDFFTLELTVTGGDGADAPNSNLQSGGMPISSTGGEGEEVIAFFDIPATGRLIYITGEAGTTSSDGRFGGGGGGSAIWYDPDGVNNNGNEVLLIVGAGGAGAHYSAFGGSSQTLNAFDLGADPQVFPSGPAPTSSAVAAGGDTPSSVGAGGGGGFGFDGDDASTTVTGGLAATFAGVSLGGVGELGANGGAGFGGGGGGGPAAQGNDIDAMTDDERAGGGGGGYVGGAGGAYDDGRDPNDGTTDRVFRSEGGASYINDAPGGGVVLQNVDSFEGGGQGTGINADGVITISCSQVVPVELTQFTATPEGNTILLAWTTASEINNSGFNIERSQDGNTWKTLDFVKGNGTSIETQTYKYLDTRPLSPLNYYRLKQLDNDGTSTYSEIIVVEVEANKSKDLSIFPNPVSRMLYYHIPTMNLDTKHTLTIHDWLGRMLFRYEQNATTAINIENLEPGTYNIIVSGDTWRYTKRFMKQ